MQNTKVQMRHSDRVFAAPQVVLCQGHDGRRGLRVCVLRLAGRQGALHAAHGLRRPHRSGRRTTARERRVEVLCVLGA